MSSTIEPVDLLGAILRAQLAFIDKSDAGAAFCVLIEDLIRLTHSQMGFIGRVAPNQQGCRELTIAAFGGLPAPTPTHLPIETWGGRLVFADREGVFSRPDTLFARAIATGEPVLARPPETDVLLNHLPPGHPPVQTFLALPILLEGEVIALAGLANRHEPYVQDDVRALAPLTVSIARMLAAQQGESERRALVARLKLLAAVYENAQEGITITQLDGTIIDVNPRFTEITGYGREEVIGQTPRILNSGRHGPSFYADMWSALHGTGHWRGEIWNRRKNGEIYPEILSISRFKGDDDQLDHYVAVFSDISDLKKQEARLEHLAYHDALTQLPNRILFADRLQVALSQAKRGGYKLAVCYLDLDGFKPINDRFGHQYGDELLIEIARRLSQSLRGGDSVARIGGDEFVLLLNELQSMAECDVILERLLQSIAEPVELGARCLTVTASLGVTIYPEDDADADTLLRHADQSLYVAKESGRNRFHVFDTLHDYETRARQAGRQRFEAGLAAGHLVLHYQPKVDMRVGRVIGVEALTRWQDPEIGMISPAQFLQFIENTPADIALGEWVIQEALRQLRDWYKSGLGLMVSINISAYHLAQPDFVSRLEGFLKAYPELPPDVLEIEILETAALEDIGHVASLMTECHALGVSFALDDFGTGYSSLSYFKRLPISTLKIDQGFVRDMLHDDDDLAIVEGVIGLSRAFRRAVIAEGVETVAHGVRLLQMGCDLAQGYGIARPMPSADFIPWHATWKPFEAWTIAAGVSASKYIDALLIAEEDHRRWLDEVKQYLDSPPSEATAAPALDARHCRFGQWLAGDGLEHYGQHAKFHALREDHQRLHALATELVALHRQGEVNTCRMRLTELEEITGSVITGLHKLLIEISMN